MLLVFGHLSPAIATVETQQKNGITDLPDGLLLLLDFYGALFLYYPDKKNTSSTFIEKENAEGPKTDLKKIELLVLAIALHNIPEGLAVGVAGALASGMDIGMELGGSNCFSYRNGNTKCS